MTEKNIIYPKFLGCQNYTLDDYWNDVFMGCSCNKFPRGTRYNEKENTLTVRVPLVQGKYKTENIQLPEDSKELYECMIDIFKEKMGMYSPLDLHIKREELEDIQDQYKIDLDCEWKKLKPRSVKDTLIMSYGTSLKNKYQLSSKETKNLISVINLGFQFKKLTSDDIDYREREIKNIKGLKFNPETRTFYITNPPRKVNKSEKTVKSQKFLQAVDKYFKESISQRLILT